MIKILFIVILAMLIGFKANSKEIILKKCYNPLTETKFNSEEMNNYYFKIDTSKKKMNSIVNWKKMLENGVKVKVVQYNLKYIDDNIVQGFVAEDNGQSTSSEVIVDLNDKTVSVFGLIVACE